MALPPNISIMWKELLHYMAWRACSAESGHECLGEFHTILLHNSQYLYPEGNKESVV